MFSGLARFTCKLTKAQLLGSAALALVVTAVVPARATVSYSYTLDNAGDPGQSGAHVVLLDNFAGVDLLAQDSYYLAPNGMGGLARVDCATVTTTTASCNSAIGSPPSVRGTPDTAGPPGAAGFLAITASPDSQSPAGPPGFFDLSVAGLGLDNISFYAGSIDQRNGIQLLDSTGAAIFTITGTDLGASSYYTSPGAGRVTLSWNPATDDVAALQLFDYDIPAFELSNVTTDAPPSSVLPEPSSLGIALAGLAGLAAAGLFARRSGKQA